MRIDMSAYQEWCDTPDAAGAKRRDTSPRREAYKVGFAAGLVTRVRPPTVKDGLSLKQRTTAVELLKCCEAWEPDVRVMGNVKACDAANLLRHVLAAAWCQ